MHFLWKYSVNAKDWSDLKNLLNVLPKMHKTIIMVKNLQIQLNFSKAEKAEKLKGCRLKELKMWQKAEKL